MPQIFLGGLLLYLVLMQSARKFVGAIDYEVKKLKFRAFPPGGTLSLQLKNNNNKGFTITNIAGSIIYQNQVISSFSSVQDITLIPGQSVTAQIDFSIVITGVITTILNIVSSGGVPNLNFTVKGLISAAGFQNVPFESVVGYELIQ